MCYLGMAVFITIIYDLGTAVYITFIYCGRIYYMVIRRSYRRGFPAKRTLPIARCVYKFATISRPQ